MQLNKEQKRQKKKKSGSAIFMYCVIGATLVISLICFILYYGNFFRNAVSLWTGVTAFTVMYHLWLRIIMGNVTKLFKIHRNQRFFRELPFEKRIYKLLRVRKWKEKVLTYNPGAYDVKNHTLPEIANTMCKSETDHWINVIISLTTLLFSLLWGKLPIFLISAIAAILFDSQFIIVQRYNRPRVMNVIERRTARGKSLKI